MVIFAISESASSSVNPPAISDLYISWSHTADSSKADKPSKPCKFSMNKYLSEATDKLARRVFQRYLKAIRPYICFGNSQNRALKRCNASQPHFIPRNSNRRKGRKVAFQAKLGEACAEYYESKGDKNPGYSVPRDFQ